MVKIIHRPPRPSAELAITEWPGDGPAVVLTHGAGLDQSTFEVQAEALADRGLRVITWDLRAHGASAMSSAVRFTADDALDDLVTVLDAFALERPAFVGHSLGGNLSQALVATHPERAACLIVVDAAWNAGPLSGGDRLSLRLARPALALVPARSLPGMMARASAVRSEAIARAEAVFGRMPKRTFLDVWAATASLVDPVPGYRTPVPLALVRGERDRAGNIATAMPRWANAEGVVEQVVAGAVHIVTWDAPAAVSRVLLETLESWELLSGPQTGSSA